MPEGDLVNVANLLPGFPRARYHTYPEPVGLAINGPQDCHYSSFNFWNDVPDDQFLNSSLITETLLTAYDKIEKPTQLGDLLLLVNDKESGIHSAIFIADDVFFTKNGSNIAVPWQFMRRADMIDYYATLGVSKTMAFRKKGL
jgi:hypothetical protein